MCRFGTHEDLLKIAISKMQLLVNTMNIIKTKFN